MPGVAPLKIRGFGFFLLEHCVVPVSLFLQPVKVPLDGTTTLWDVSHSSQFDVTCKLPKGTLCSPIQMLHDALLFAALVDPPS